jgi:hypothetical protein
VSTKSYASTPSRQILIRVRRNYVPSLSEDNSRSQEVSVRELHDMAASRHSIAQLARRAIAAAPKTPSAVSAVLNKSDGLQTRAFATPVPPVTQNAAGSKGPTAMVFLNMGGPSTTDEVGDFLSRLFVSFRCSLQSPWVFLVS